uniref:DUF6816 domain-containing protein n=1 Tax=Pseudo-nitzschia australis TaxID=44445 RepID=A0A7S4AB41_9STRA|mmetsp:Transcript_7363/g.15759  ORF Transcript_7363/g.15759 Transcript_7363/m.15759 type:complete len:367 (+) Transcript_7363:71-1171(+)
MASNTIKKMKGRSVNNGLCCAIIICYVALTTGLVQHEHRHQEVPPAASTSRRTFGIVSTASLSSLLIGNPSTTFEALADPLNALIPAGSGAVLQQLATIKRSDGWKESPPRLLTQLGISRIAAAADESPSSSKSITPLQQSLSPFSDRELYYPSSFAGEWSVTSTLQQKIFPYGPDFVPSRSLVEGSPRNRGEQVGDSTSYAVRYMSDSEKTINDRAFNLVSMSRSYQQMSPVIADSIVWNSKKDPTRLTYQTEPIAADMRPVGPRKAEVYLTARKTEESTSGEQQIFAAAERGRTITVGTGSVSANDQEIITEFRTIDGDTMRAISRIAVYLTPNPNSREGVLWQQVNGKAVAFYDYEMVMERKK